jgi:hypothetical protein
MTSLLRVPLWNESCSESWQEHLRKMDGFIAVGVSTGRASERVIDVEAGALPWDHSTCSAVWYVAQKKIW